MSIFKTMWNKTTQKQKQQDTGSQEAEPEVDDEDERPFDMDFKNMWKYDTEELCEYILKYEEYIQDLRRKYQGIGQEYMALKEKITAYDKERKLMTEELEHYKLQSQNLKQFIEEQNGEGGLSNSQRSAGGKSQSVVSNFENGKHNVESLLKKHMGSDKILTIPALNEVRNGLASIYGYAEELIKGFNTMEKVALQDDGNNGEGGSKEDKEELWLVEEQIRITMIKITQAIGSIVEKSVSQLSTFVNKAREVQEQSAASLKGELELIVKAQPGKATAETEITSTRAELSTADSSILIETLEKQNHELKALCVDYEQKLKNIEAENNKKLEDFKKRIEVQISEVRKKAVDDKKFTDEVMNQNQQLENKNSEMEDEISTLNRHIADLKQKIERLEKELKAAKEVEASRENNLIKAAEDSDRKVRDLADMNAKLEAAQKIIADLERGKNNLAEEINILKEDMKNALNGQEINTQQTQIEITDLKLKVNSMKQEIEKQQNMIAASEAKKVDLENKLIQERLKSEQLKRDVSKLEESYKEARESLTEQVGKNHDDLKRLENLENELLETRKKSREYKKGLKRSETQNRALQGQLKEEQAGKAKLEQELGDKKKETNADGLTPRTSEMTGKDIMIRSLSVEVRQLSDKNEHLIADNTKLHQETEKLESLLREERKQLNLLKDKREAGVKEIKRLNSLLEGMKTGNTSFSRVSMTEESDTMGRIKVVTDIKKSLEMLYKEYITSIQYENINDSKNQKKTTQEVIKAENVVKIEKKMNDILMIVLEYLETLNTSPQ